MPLKYACSRKKSITLCLLSIFIILISFVTYAGVYGLENSIQSVQPTPTMSQLIPPPYPSNPSDLPLVTNYTIIIPKTWAFGGFGLGGWTVVNMNFTAPSLSLQNEENWTINWVVQTLPFPFTTWTGNTSTISNSNMAEILPAVFNGTIINVKVDAYQNSEMRAGLIQFVGSKEWNVTEYVYSSTPSAHSIIPVLTVAALGFLIAASLIIFSVVIYRRHRKTANLNQ